MPSPDEPATHRLLGPTENGDRYELTSPTALPKAGGFLWNKTMMIHLTCRGHATAQFMQPEPAKYSHAPNIEARTFMQPEQNYYAHHPGRFVYVKDEETGLVFSAPHEPVRATSERFVFSVGKSDVSWTVEGLEGVRVEMVLTLPTHDVVELWTVRVTNTSSASSSSPSRKRKISVYPYFTVGYMSWMNQGAEYREDLVGIVASSVTPYQKAEDYPKNKTLKDKTYFLCSVPPTSWEARQEAFEGEGGLHAPSAITEASELQRSDARYETPAAAVQYRLDLAPGQIQTYHFLFGPALDDAEIQAVRNKYLSEEGFSAASSAFQAYIREGAGCLSIHTPDPHLDDFVNNWLPRQVFYHGDVNRLTTDPQTRNYLQDNMGMAYINPPVARRAIVTALSQQEKTGAMPDGILLLPGAELKYINQVPHTDHCVWLPVALEVYLNETADFDLLGESITDVHGNTLTVLERMCRAMDWLLSDNARDHRGLSYIAQGDWCDPMNMVGLKGKGVSGWLTVATGYAVKLWADLCSQVGRSDLAERYREGVKEVNQAANKYLWDGEWFARGITDDGVSFGVKDDAEGRIWLNPQAWSILGGAAAAHETQIDKMLSRVDEMLGTPYGVLMFWPPFSGMRDDIGRVTQKFPGQGENGAVYNHATAFYIHALYSIGQADRAYQLLRQMLPGPGQEDYMRRGQLPVYIPNYYRGGWKEIPDRAGRSSQLFNTGTVSWVYRSFIEGLCGLRGDAKGLRVEPQLPTGWESMRAVRTFREAYFHVNIRRGNVKTVEVVLDGERLPEAYISNVQAGKEYQVLVTVPHK
ncbi:family 94 glycoside hydrolase [Cryphonectria parasitica EP155]|uniref:Family 94 glycoside hydrolase n=1 Tax=Cryphonectria parasitica (strain ATCC 38755 / EP155) TaxID=660469 RepID=A0A9P4XVI7_CRYP1|nr:family 94 glycoside hydrolase [Cryphonectria parasitica EP155]KAF3761591.1 family 94 glycoside hydrolase [Cryphonectria parasitica EP155]